MDIKRLLAETALFRGLREESRRSLARVCRLGAVRRREVLFAEGSRGESCYVLVSGCIQLIKTAPDGRRAVVKTVEPGESFAEVVLFEQDRYPVTAVALKAGTVCRIDRAAFRRFLDEPAFRDDFIRALMDRLRYLADRIFHLASYDVEARFFRFLEETVGRRETCILPLARKDIAAAVGTTPETLSRLLLRLRKERKIALAGRVIRVRPSAWPSRDR
jgi:CRP/FNR family transcriptional regulator